MTGTTWFDTTTAIGFALLAALAVGRALTRRRSPAERVDAAAHALMAAGMSAMALGTGDPVPAGAWAAAFVVVGTASTAVLLRSAWGRPGPPIRGPGPPAAGSRHRAVPAGAAHHLAASVLMVVALAGGHAHTDPPADAAGAAPHAQHMDHGGPDGHARHDGHAAGLGDERPSEQQATVVPAPVMGAAGLGFLGYAGWQAAAFVRSRRAAGGCTCAGPGRLDALCAVAMSAGMGLMAITMA